MKKILSVLFAAAVLATCMIGFSACGDDGTHTVTIVARYLNWTGEYERESKRDIPVEDGAVFTMQTLGEYIAETTDPEDVIYDSVFGYGFYLDENYRTKYPGTPIIGDTTLYMWEYLGPGMPYPYICFVYRGEKYMYYAPPKSELSADAFSRSAYGIGAPEDYLYFSDEACTQPYTLEGDVMPKKDMFRSVYVIDAE